MAKYRVEKVSVSVAFIKLGREKVGSMQLSNGTWSGGIRIKDLSARHTDADFSTCFRELVRKMNNERAKAHGYENAREMIRANNEVVIREANEFNKLLSDSGLDVPFRVVVKKQGKVLV